MKSSRLLSLFFALIVADCLVACGGGGGGGGSDFIGAAQVNIQASPTRIDTADRMLVQAQVDEVNESGISLKFKFPFGMAYVSGSASLVADAQSLDITPTVNVAENNFRYVVFYLDQDTFGKGKNGRVEFFLEGVSRVIEGKLEVDADVDNPLINNDVEFDAKNPDFAAEDSVVVNVEG